MRPPVIEDVPFIYECYKDWPPTPDKGFPTFEKVERWVRRWMYRDDEHCLVWDGIGVMTYRVGPFAAVIDNIAIHPDERYKGHSKRMSNDIKEYLFNQGVLVGTFKTLPGPIRDRHPDGVVTAFDGEI